MTRSIRAWAGLAIGGALAAGAAGQAAAQSTASSYSMGTYNPVQAQIWRDQINGAILKQATGKNGHAAGRRAARSRTHARKHVG